MTDALSDAILHQLIDEKYQNNNLLAPQLLSNSKSSTIWQAIHDELLTCTSFTWCVAFITEDFLAPFKLIMEELNSKNISGTLITGTYLGFNNPRIFQELLKIRNLQVLVSSEPLHTKGYFFNHITHQTCIIGSANFTRSALLKNAELCVKISSKNNAPFVKQIKTIFKSLSQKSQKLTTSFINDYSQTWSKPATTSSSKTKNKISPNRMQNQALKEINKLEQSGQKRALVVSATGTGKTYLAAFAVKNYAPKRFLYIVHREQIAQKSLKSFQKVMDEPAKNFGLLTGHKHEQAKYTFSTVQTLSQDKVLEKYPRDYFDYIVVDEAHRAAAPSYRKVMEYFEPEFYLGLTATPERMDEQNVYQIFDYNLAYEIRLRDALEEKMLTPFHYIGISDYELLSDKASLSQLSSEKRVNYILKELNYYGYDGPQPCGLVFCSRQDEARALAKAFNQRKHPACALTNQDSNAVRQKAINDLINGKFEYIICVDLFNEGIDIPKLNQIIMLRNTQSSIVFLQQLGRGLRLYPGQKFVTVIDFIGNYKNNYLIPVSLNKGKITKDGLRKQLLSTTFAGISTISFSRIASEEILKSLDKVKLDSLKELKDNYLSLKGKIGKAPLLLDFEKKSQISALLFAENKSLDHYGNFLQKMGENIVTNDYENKVLSFVTHELLNGKRPHELLLLKLLITKTKLSKQEFIEQLTKQDFYISEELLQSVRNILTLSFFNVKSGKSTKKIMYGDLPIVEFTDNFYHFNSKIQSSLKSNSDFTKLFNDVINTGLLISKQYNPKRQFTLYKQYSRKDACRLLNWPLDVSAPMYGYRVGENDCPIFITYQKDDKEKLNGIYNNQLSDWKSLRWYTRSPRHLNSPEVKRLLDKSKPITLHIFVKPSDSYGKQFYYLGQADIDYSSVKEETLPNKKTAVGMNLILKTPITSEIYHQIFEN